MISRAEAARLGLAVVVGAVAGALVYRVTRPTPSQAPSGKKKPVRVFIDGCFDLFHFGHANSFRQARALGDYLLVGLNPDSEVTRVKGPPIMTEEERFVSISAVKWVDEVIRDVPYTMNAEYLDWLIKEYDIDFVVHGDDPCLDEHGNDVYAAAKARGKYREIKRTEGVSTTDIVGRMLSLTKHHHTHEDETVRPPESISSHYSELAESEDGFAHSFTRVSSFLPTSSRIMQFSSGRTPKKNDRIGYVSGVWDMCGPGHVQFLKEARKHCDFLLVGVHRDDTANYHRGGNFPILNLHERALGVLCLRYTDEIILGAPWVVSKDLMTTMNITVCITGTKTDSAPLRDDEVDPYELPRSMGKLVVISSPSSLSTEDIVDRVVKDREQYQKKFDAKHKKEQVYLDHKSYVPEVTKH